MSSQDLEYFRDRAVAERERAKSATGEAAAIHLELASLYDKLIELDQRETPTPSFFANGHVSV